MLCGRLIICRFVIIYLVHFILDFRVELICWAVCLVQALIEYEVLHVHFLVSCLVHPGYELVGWLVSLILNAVAQRKSVLWELLDLWLVQEIESGVTFAHAAMLTVRVQVEYHVLVHARDLGIIRDSLLEPGKSLKRGEVASKLLVNVLKC